MTAPELLPCPFCGSHNLARIPHLTGWEPGIMCRQCYASATKAATWNTRAAIKPQP